ncbi:MAG TPA: hypothetical protein VM692_13010 [Gammaproteobacteria bacterium]|nr:hypothetical protein [Gammaproteobacteria bacterium]
MRLFPTVGTLVSVAVVLALAAYPLVVYTTIGRFGPTGVAALLAAVCLARLVILKLRAPASFGGGYLTAVCVGGLLLAAASFWLDSTGAVLYYPVLVNAALLVVFAASLVSPPSAIERIARLRDPDLPPAAVVYTRRVTIVWAVFFALNGAAALYTALCTTLETWALYNGLIAYVLIGALFAAELAIRTAVKSRLQR